MDTGRTESIALVRRSVRAFRVAMVGRHGLDGTRALRRVAGNRPSRDRSATHRHRPGRATGSRAGRDRIELVMGLAYGPIGALFGSFTDAADAKKFAEAAKEPVIGIHYRVGEGENAIFLKYSSAHKRQHAEDILSAALAEQHRP